MAHPPQIFPAAHNFSITGPVFNSNSVSTSNQALLSMIQSALHATQITPPNSVQTNSVQDNIAAGNKSDSAVYARQLMTEKRGYPLWRPQDHDPRLPDIYKQNGVHIGDVGILNEFGGFDYLFNACHPADHPLNEGRVPKDFKHLEIDNGDTKESPQEFEPGSYVESKPSCMSKTMISGQHPPGVPEEVGAGLSFSSSATNGALLILPEGGKRIDHSQLASFYEYAAECAQSWYAHIKGRGVHNGALYLVTGFDKARAWGVVSFTDANPGSVSLEFIPKAPTNVRGLPGYWFRRRNCASALSDADSVFGNQSGCVFLRGFKIAIRHNPFTNIPKLCSSVKYISDLDADELFPKPKAIGNFSPWQYIPQPYHTPSALSNEYSVLPNHIYHPSDVINAWVLSNYDEVEVSIAHDNDWTSVIRDDEEGMPSNQELIHRINKHLKLMNGRDLTHARFDLHTQAKGPAEVADENVTWGRGRQPNTSRSIFSSRKRRKDNSDESSSEDDRLFVAEPQMPEKQTQDRINFRPASGLALGKKKAPAASISTAHIAVGSSHATSSTTRRNQLEEQHIAVMGGQEAVGTSQASSLATKAQLSLPSFPRKRRKRSASDKGKWDNEYGEIPEMGGQGVDVTPIVATTVPPSQLQSKSVSPALGSSASSSSSMSLNSSRSHNDRGKNGGLLVKAEFSSDDDGEQEHYVVRVGVDIEERAEMVYAMHHSSTEAKASPSPSTSQISTPKTAGMDGVEVPVPDFDSGSFASYSSYFLAEWDRCYGKAVLPPRFDVWRLQPSEFWKSQLTQAWTQQNAQSPSLSPSSTTMYRPVGPSAASTSSVRSPAPAQSVGSYSQPYSPSPSLSPSSSRNPKSFICHICFKELGTKQTLKGHIRAHEPGQRLICPKGCGTTFSYSQALRRHLRESRCPRHPRAPPN